MNLATTAVILDHQHRATTMPVTETFWQDLDAQHGDFAGKLLISSYHFDSDWPTWEIHPHGDEIVQLQSGEVEFVLEEPTGLRRVHLDQPGSFVIVPRNTWHTAKVRKPSVMLFITPGQGTQNRPV